MAAVRSPETLTRLAPARQSTVSTAPKLRDSCHACAASKVKCNKEKPTCARCAKRHINCEYFATKRAGRRHDTRPSDTKKMTLALPVSSSSTAETSILTSPSLVQPSPGQHTSAYSDILPNLRSPTDPDLSSSLTALGNDFEDFFASPISFAMPETFDPEILPQPHIDFTGFNDGSLDSNDAAAFLVSDDAFSILDEIVSERPTLSRPRSPSASQASSNSTTQNLQGFRSEESPCYCLIRALGLLKQLFPTASTTCMRSSRQSNEDTTSQLPTIQFVVAENKRIIEAISDMLYCPCSQDGYLLTVMSIIVFKVLGWYAAAARETPVTDDGQWPRRSHLETRPSSSGRSEQVLQSPAVVGSYCIDGEDQGRMAAQLILSELHGVQRLVNVLSQRLKGSSKCDGALGTPNSAVDGQDTLSDAGPFSATMFDQLEVDLRKRLRALSLEIVDVLRRG